MASIEDLDNSEKTRKIDASGMLSVVAEMPGMLTEAYGLSEKIVLPKTARIRQVVVSGMGGSAIAGNIASNLFLYKAKLPIYINRDYRIPAFVDGETLFLAFSYSGNTEETISAVKEAARCGAKIVCVSSGGKLKAMAESAKYPLCLLPTGYQPRAALPFLLVSLLNILQSAGIVAGIKEELDEAVIVLQKLKRENGVSAPLRGNPAKQLAKKLVGKMPLVFGSAGATSAAALRFKTQFNENSKATALFNVFPELNHNEIVNLFALKREESDFCAIFLRDEADHERVKKRIEITKSLIGKQLGGIQEVWSQGQSALARTLSLIYFGDLVSVYLAIARGIDPTEVEVITRLKKEMAR